MNEEISAAQSAREQELLERVLASFEGASDDRLKQLTQSLARERNRSRIGRVEEVLVEGASRTDALLLRGRTRRNTMVNFVGDAAPGELVTVPDAGIVT